MISLGSATIIAANHTVKRTLDEHAGDWFNVKGFGAIGDNLTDDTVAIQNAVNALAASTSLTRGVVFFPPGLYRTTAPITFNVVGDASIIFEGAGDASMIAGNFAGYVFDRYLSPGNLASGIKVFERLFIQNSHLNGGGIRCASGINVAIRDCKIGSPHAINMEGPGSYGGQSWVIDDCYITAGGNRYIGDGSFGINTGGNVTISGCDFAGFDVAINAWGFGVVVLACRIEVNGTGIRGGLADGGVPFSLGGLVVLGGSFQSNATGIDLYAGCGGGVISGFTMHGFPGASLPLTAEGAFSDTQYGIRCRAGGAANHILITGVNIAGAIQQASIEVQDAPNPANIVFMGCQASNSIGDRWRLLGRAGTCRLIDCYDSQTNKNVVQTFTYALLPTNPVEGMEYDITDASTNVWGVAVVGGGSNHVKARYNGTNWTVVGK